MWEHLFGGAFPVKSVKFMGFLPYFLPIHLVTYLTKVLTIQYTVTICNKNVNNTEEKLISSYSWARVI